MAKVVVYTSQWCPYCVQAKALLQHKGVRFDEIDVSSDDDLRMKMIEESGRRTVPQIFINDVPIGATTSCARWKSRANSTGCWPRETLWPRGPRRGRARTATAVMTGDAAAPRRACGS